MVVKGTDWVGKKQCHFTDTFNRNLTIFNRNHPKALEVHWSYVINFNELLIRAHTWIRHKISMLFFKHGKNIKLETHFVSLRQM